MIVEEVKCLRSGNGCLIVTDGTSFTMDVNEFGTTWPGLRHLSADFAWSTGYPRTWSQSSFIAGT